MKDSGLCGLMRKLNEYQWRWIDGWVFDITQIMMHTWPASAAARRSLKKTRAESCPGVSCIFFCSSSSANVSSSFLFDQYESESSFGPSKPQKPVLFVGRTPSSPAFFFDISNTASACSSFCIAFRRSSKIFLACTRLSQEQRRYVFLRKNQCSNNTYRYR